MLETGPWTGHQSIAGLFVEPEAEVWAWPVLSVARITAAFGSRPVLKVVLQMVRPQMILSFGDCEVHGKPSACTSRGSPLWMSEVCLGSLSSFHLQWFYSPCDVNFQCLRQILSSFYQWKVPRASG